MMMMNRRQKDYLHYIAVISGFVCIYCPRCSLFVSTILAQDQHRTLKNYHKEFSTERMPYISLCLCSGFL